MTIVWKVYGFGALTFVAALLTILSTVSTYWVQSRSNKQKALFHIGLFEFCVDDKSCGMISYFETSEKNVAKSKNVEKLKYMALCACAVDGVAVVLTLLRVCLYCFNKRIRIYFISVLLILSSFFMFIVIAIFEKIYTSVSFETDHGRERTTVISIVKELVFGRSYYAANAAAIISIFAGLLGIYSDLEDREDNVTSVDDNKRKIKQLQLTEDFYLYDNIIYVDFKIS